MSSRDSKASQLDQRPEDYMDDEVCSALGSTVYIPRQSAISGLDIAVPRFILSASIKVAHAQWVYSFW